MTDNKICVCIVGKSGTGKSTIVNSIPTIDILNSYTTRPPRFPNEKGHIFITEEEYDKLENIIAETKFGKYRYCATKSQIDNSDVYILDKNGVKAIDDNYIGKDNKRDIFVIYVKTKFIERLKRCIKDDGFLKGIKRMLRDIGKFNHMQYIADYVVNNNTYNDFESIRMLLTSLVDV